MKYCDENLKLDDSFATNKKLSLYAEEDFLLGMKLSNKVFSKISLKIMIYY